MDTPRIDLKIRPFYEDEKSGVALCKTHYYGGVKKYQWTSIPLALTGVIVKLDGEIVEIDIGSHEELYQRCEFYHDLVDRQLLEDELEVTL